MPPPRQKPTAASFTSGARRASSVRPDLRFATDSSGGIWVSAAVASAGSANVAVPPLLDSRSMASAE